MAVPTPHEIEICKFYMWAIDWNLFTPINWPDAYYYIVNINYKVDGENRKP